METIVFRAVCQHLDVFFRVASNASSRRRDASRTCRVCTHFVEQTLEYSCWVVAFCFAGYSGDALFFFRCMKDHLPHPPRPNRHDQDHQDHHHRHRHRHHDQSPPCLRIISSRTDRQANEEWTPRPSKHAVLRTCHIRAGERIVASHVEQPAAANTEAATGEMEKMQLIWERLLANHSRCITSSASCSISDRNAAALVGWRALGNGAGQSQRESGAVDSARILQPDKLHRRPQPQARRLQVLEFPSRGRLLARHSCFMAQSFPPVATPRCSSLWPPRRAAHLISRADIPFFSSIVAISRSSAFARACYSPPTWSKSSANPASSVPF